MFIYTFSLVTMKQPLTHRGRVTHICACRLTIIGSDNALSPVQRQAIIWTNAGILSIGPLGTNFSDILIKIDTFSFTKMHLKIMSGKWRPFCLSLNVLRIMSNKSYKSTILITKANKAKRKHEQFNRRWYGHKLQLNLTDPAIILPHVTEHGIQSRKPFFIGHLISMVPVGQCPSLKCHSSQRRDGPFIWHVIWSVMMGEMTFFGTKYCCHCYYNNFMCAVLIF